MKRVFLLVECIACLLLCSCGNRGVSLPKLTPAVLDELYQQEFDAYTDKLPGPVDFGFASLTYNGRVYTAGRDDHLCFAYEMEQPFDTGEKSLTDFPLEKLGDVYGEVFVKPVYGDLNDDGKYSDVYAWYDDAAKADDEHSQGTVWKFGEYDPEHLVALTIPEEDGHGNMICELVIFYHLNDIRIESGKDLLDRILNPLNAELYGVVKQPDTLRTLSGEKPEDVYFLGDLYQSTVVTKKAVKNPEQYTTVHIREKEPYGRTLCFRDYGDGVYGDCTPEETVIYLKKESRVADG